MRENWCEVSVCVLASVHSVRGHGMWVFWICRFPTASQTLSVSQKRGASEQCKRAKAGMETTPFQSVPERTPLTAVPRMNAIATKTDVAWPAVGSVT